MGSGVDKEKSKQKRKESYLSDAKIAPKKVKIASKSASLVYKINSDMFFFWFILLGPAVVSV